jgi:hypothetical protein
MDEHRSGANFQTAWDWLVWGKDPRIVETSLFLPPTNVDPSGSIFRKATVIVITAA